MLLFREKRDSNPAQLNLSSLSRYDTKYAEVELDSAQNKLTVFYIFI